MRGELGALKLVGIPRGYTMCLEVGEIKEWGMFRPSVMKRLESVLIFESLLFFENLDTLPGGGRSWADNPGMGPSRVKLCTWP